MSIKSNINNGLTLNFRLNSLNVNIILAIVSLLSLAIGITIFTAFLYIGKTSLLTIWLIVLAIAQLDVVVNSIKLEKLCCNKH